MRTNERSVSHRRTILYRARTAEYLARDLLRAQGYSVLRSCDPDSPINMVAWIPAGGILLIRIVTTRRAIAGASDIAHLWREDIDRLRSEPVPENCEIHLWVSTDRKGWHRYQVLVGGIAETEV